jgi:glycosyltransferase involved in cell wall biosynthesis
VEAAKNRKPSVSIVIPVHNEAAHIQACLDSIARQTIAPKEVIIVDNNSTDNTVELARTYPRVTVVPAKKQGIVHARNVGFDTASADIIARSDGDIVLPETWVEHIQNFYAEPENLQKCWTSGGYFYNVRLPHLVSWAYNVNAFWLNKLLIGYFTLWGSSMAITAAQWQAVRSETHERTDIHEDLDLTIHLAQAGYSITYDRGIKTRAELRRVHADRHKLWEYLQWWPRTLRMHKMWQWLPCWLLTVIPLYSAVYVLVVWDNLVRLFGRPKLPY